MGHFLSSVLVSIGILCGMALVAWLAFKVTCYAGSLYGLWGMIPVGIVVAGVSGGLIWFGIGLLCMIWFFSL
jgi:hypothetical protein